MENESENKLKVFNTDKLISENIVFTHIKRYDDATYLARTGIPKNPEDMPKDQNQTVENRIIGLKLMIANQLQIIEGHVLAIVKKNCLNAWMKKNKTDEERKKNPFEEEENDYNEAKAISKLLHECEEEIEFARKTKTKKDDYIWDRMDQEGNIAKEITSNFHKMLTKLIEIYEGIEEILIDHKIVNLGNSEDEEVTFKQQEETFLERFTEA